MRIPYATVAAPPYRYRRACFGSRVVYLTGILAREKRRTPIARVEVWVKPLHLLVRDEISTSCSCCMSARPLSIDPLILGAWATLHLRYQLACFVIAGFLKPEKLNLLNMVLPHRIGR